MTCPQPSCLWKQPIRSATRSIYCRASDRGSRLFLSPASMERYGRRHRFGWPTWREVARARVQSDRQYILAGYLITLCLSTTYHKRNVCKGFVPLLISETMACRPKPSQKSNSQDEYFILLRLPVLVDFAVIKFNLDLAVWVYWTVQ